MASAWSAGGMTSADMECRDRCVSVMGVVALAAGLA